ncbi:MAG TPA: SDR family oxidoreductase [Aeromicrobium sp.]|nr:SDR family oxidoreductase [Aeromicrobium sp.]
MRKTKFTDAVTVITGAGSGIGRSAAVKVVERGGRVALTDINAAGLDEVVASLPEGSVLHHAAFDVADADAVQTFADAVHAKVEAVDVVLNVAGISTWGRIQDLEAKHWRDCVEIDLMGPIHVMSAFTPKMIERGRGGHIANVSSAAGLFGLPLHAPYSAAKFGLRGVSEVLRFDLAQYDIGVSLVCPGAVDTPLVGTVNIVGIDRTDPRVGAAIKKFQRHAVSPDSAAESMLRGVEKGRSVVFTSNDIRFGWYGQRYFPAGYNLVMKIMNREATKLLDKFR